MAMEGNNKPLAGGLDLILINLLLIALGLIGLLIGSN